ncbi:hypothetical protein VF21_07961 [Pseudogymnoascus sp. 05NY08]|nr:hypothetical protein VF21_07961 [Pseudogymnoascus sp. 05NY08]
MGFHYNHTRRMHQYTVIPHVLYVRRWGMKKWSLAFGSKGRVTALIPAGGVSLLFTTALEIFSGVESAAQFSEIDEVLRVKTEVEKVRLIIWGQSVGLDGSPEQRDEALNVALGEEYLRTAVSGLLVCFIKIFEDSEKLKDRYGLVQLVNKGPGSSHYLLLGYTFWRTYNKYGGVRPEGPNDFKMPWEVSDEKLFRGLIEELKAINSSLNHMLPTIRNQTRVRLRTNIMQSTNVDKLRSLVKAADDISDLISETASLRLEILSRELASSQPGPAVPSNKVPARRPASMLQPKPALQTSNPSATVAPDAPDLQDPAAENKQATATPIPATLPERLPIRAGPPYDNTGALVMQKLASAALIPSFLLWQVGVENQGQPAPKPESNIMDRIHVPSDILPWCQRLLEVDPEGDPRYPGWAPASVSLEGLSREYQFMRIQEVDDSDAPPKKNGCRWSEITVDRGLGPKWTEEVGHQQVKNLLGPNFRIVWLDPREAVKIRHQISDILGSLNRDHIFLSFEENAGSVGAVALREQMDPSTRYTLFDFLFQLIHAKELSLRLERDKGRWHGGITRKIIYDMIAADLWMRNLEPKVGNSTFEFMVRTDIRRRQVDAMMSFAEKMKWPYLAEARKTLNDFVQQGTPVDIRTWDWVAGMALSGSMFPLTLMFGLHQACPSLNKTAPAGTVQLRHANFGMVFNQVSYWRSRSI